MSNRGRWIMVDGIGPGIGKSTLAWNLATALAERGVPVDLLPENAIFNRPEFADAAVGFRSKQFELEREALPKGYRALVRRNEASGAWVVFDWSAGSMAEDLPWAAEMDALTDHMREVTEIVGALDPALLLLDGPVEEAVRRATAERGAEWLKRYEASRFPAVQVERMQRVRQATEAVGWQIEMIDAMPPPNEVLSSALRVLRIEQ